MIISKEITKDNELLVYMNGKCIYKKWLNTGQSKVFDVMAYDKYSYASITNIDINNTEHLIHVKARLTMRPIADGGRQTGFKSGYRPNHVFKYGKNSVLNTFDGDIQFNHADLILPGTTHEVTVRFLSQQRIDKYLEIGRKWWIHEGSLCLGEAEILSVMFP
jgi:hypothetical protein